MSVAAFTSRTEKWVADGREEDTKEERCEGERCVPVVEHCVSSAKVVGSIPREHTYCQKIYSLNAM